MNINHKELTKFEETIEEQILDGESTLAVDLFSFIDELVADIQHLEDEVIMLRRDYAALLPERESRLLRSDIFSDLSVTYYNSKLFNEYCRCFHNGVNPLDSEARSERVMKIAEGLLNSR
jgi:hypothetical protein